MAVSEREPCSGAGIAAEVPGELMGRNIECIDWKSEYLQALVREYELVAFDFRLIRG